MATWKQVKTQIAAAREQGRVPYSLLDVVLERRHALGRELPRILVECGQAPLFDDRLCTRILGRDAREAGANSPSPLRRFVARARFLQRAEEVRLARRIEFARRRLERMIVSSNAPGEVRECFFDRIETPEVARGALPGLPLPGAPDEQALRDRWEEYIRLRNDLIEANLPLIGRIAARYRTYGIPDCDLIQHGSLGLIRAADKFDWRKNVRFRTYAEWWIRQAIERATDTDRDVIHIPRPVRQKISRARLARRAQGHDEPLDARRFSDMMGVERGAAARIFSVKSGIASLERTGLADGRPIKDDLVGPDLAGREELEEIEHLRSRLDGMILQLPEREQQVINLRYGLGGLPPHTLEQVGDILRISRERVRQLQLRAIGHLKIAGPDPRVAVET